MKDDVLLVNLGSFNSHIHQEAGRAFCRTTLLHVWSLMFNVRKKPNMPTAVMQDGDGRIGLEAAVHEPIGTKTLLISTVSCAKPSKQFTRYVLREDFMYCAAQSHRQL